MIIIWTSRRVCIRCSYYTSLPSDINIFHEQTIHSIVIGLGKSWSFWAKINFGTWIITFLIETPRLSWNWRWNPTASLCFTSTLIYSGKSTINFIWFCYSAFLIRVWRNRIVSSFIETPWKSWFLWRNPATSFGLTLTLIYSYISAIYLFWIWNCTSTRYSLTY